MDPVLAAVAAAAFPPATSVVSPSGTTSEALERTGLDSRTAALTDLAAGSVDGLALLEDELSRAGPHAEGLVAEAARALRPGGLLVASATGAVLAEATGRSPDPDALRPFTADGLARLLGHAGFTVEGRYAPGAASRLAGRERSFDPHLDRMPGLLDASERVVAVARRYTDGDGRSRAFFASLPRKVVAAAVVCRDAAGRLLLVHDRFRDHWTIPGGVVDADESPRDGAVREAWEESGVAVAAGHLLGVFAASWPDRLTLVFDARPVTESASPPAPVHTHEIGAVEWVPLPEALDRLAPHIAEQVRRSLEQPGGLWRQ